MLVYSKPRGSKIKSEIINVIEVPIDMNRVDIYRSSFDETFITFKHSADYNYLGIYKGKFKKIIALNSNKSISKINPT